MAVPVFLQPSFNYLQTLGVTDVAASITRAETQAVALGWSNPGAGHIISPPNSVGQFIEIELTRIAATTIEMVFTDSFSRTFTRRCDTPASFTERMYLNTFGFFFDPGNGEGLWGSLLDLSPELQDAHDQAFVGHGSRDAAGSLDSTFSAVGGEILDASNPRAYVPLVKAGLVPRGSLDCQGNCLYSQTGSRMWYPCAYVGEVISTTKRYRGRVFQALWVSDNDPAQSEIVVPLDQASTGLFKLTGFFTLSGYGQNVARYRMAVRKA